MLVLLCAEYVCNTNVGGGLDTTGRPPVCFVGKIYRADLVSVRIAASICFLYVTVVIHFVSVVIAH